MSNISGEENKRRRKHFGEINNVHSVITQSCYRLQSQIADQTSITHH